jgi:hypothetical protein
MAGYRPEYARRHAKLRLVALGILIPNGFLAAAAPGVLHGAVQPF